MLKLFLTSMLIFLASFNSLNAQRVKKLDVGDLFPTIEGELLSSKEIRLPDHCKGKISLLIVAFKRGTQPQIDTWTKPVMKEFSMYEDFRFIEIPMISNFYSWISNYIDNGMRKGIVPSMHKNVMTYYGPLSDYYKYFDVDDKKQCYVFLLNREGKIEFMSKGEAESHKILLLLDKIRKHLNK
ncbi:hypothetical protein [Marinifilum caeruleilacunae]|uniref:ATP10 protein n=1 Tax=Marinifilum caeruleilacunae TaxID=2499076 RepID=A0ABX1WY57_9BACT|nr:hypothetical protein [Marinifilum caeruleilacunae]NOU60921.1 hypothetical protein [Marinifilum caeruleilacunae]